MNNAARSTILGFIVASVLAFGFWVFNDLRDRREFIDRCIVSLPAPQLHGGARDYCMALWRLQ